MSERVLLPNVAGSFYPANPTALSAEVDRRMGGASPTGEADGSLLAMIAPHAGYAYSGDVAAAGFRLLRGRRVRRVIVLGPSHYVGFEGGALPTASCLRTPLGEVPIDETVVPALAALRAFRREDHPFVREHSIEVEIPFLQKALVSGWTLVPVLVGPRSAPSDLQQLAAGLSPLVDADTILVASSDFTHYGRAFDYVPFGTEVESGLRRLDDGAIDRILACDTTGFEAYVRKTGATICGRHAIDVLLRILRDRVDASLLAYDTSGRMTSDWTHSVSYASIAFRRRRS